VQARKLKSNGSGNEAPMTLNDYVDIGVFTGKKDEEKPIYLKKEKINRANQTFEIVVDQMPTRAGIDPYNKVIDRIPDDNTLDVAGNESVQDRHGARIHLKCANAKEIPGEHDRQGSA
jgi:hypothetical protein